ncbi:MAG: phytanoyl-CoA dioxygenase family protein, partial [Chloroflexales bacterium]|nr:phytanoyl-CoA dioxygenase family protein [Chloroflexales bacterium]
ADTTQSFTDVIVPLPPGVSSVPVIMEPGDVLFFNGQLVHGSNPNTTSDRFRRALIGHYIEGDSQKVAQWYFPALRMDGTTIGLESSGKGTACGVWVDHEGQAVAEVSGFEVVEKTTE